ncbi:MAG: cyclic nucleotide-binding domain-containing protein [Melioribacteraceae bacterium]|nr:cyclic nucleotide-binding domain-containing protein [Melioribacteraceae bacterium]
MEKHILQTLSDTKLFDNIDFEYFDSDKVVGELITVSEGQIIYHENSEVDAIYLIISGEIDILIKSAANRKTSIIHSDNQFFGQHEYTANSKRVSTSVAITDSYLIKLKPEVLDYLIEQNPDIKENLNQLDNLIFEDDKNRKPKLPDEIIIEPDIAELEKAEIENADDELEVFDDEDNENEKDEEPIIDIDEDEFISNIANDIKEKSSLNIDEALLYEEINKVEFGENYIENSSDYYEKYETTEEMPIPTSEVGDYTSSDDIIIDDSYALEESSDETSPEQNVIHEQKTDLEAEYSKLILENISTIISSNDLESLEKSIVTAVETINDAKNVVLYFVNNLENTLFTRSSKGHKGLEVKLDFDAGITGWIAKNKKPVLFEENDKIEEDHEILKLKLEFPDESSLYFPFIDGDNNCVAVIQLMDKGENVFTTDDELKLFLLGKIVVPKINQITSLERELNKSSDITFNKFAHFLQREIKKPMLISKRYAEHLKNKGLPEDAEKVILMLNNQISDVTELIMTTVSFVDSSIIARPVTVNLNNVLEDFSQKVYTYLEENNSSIKNKFDESVLVKLDLKLFYQCYSEIVKNAVEAMPEGGAIEIITKKSEGKIKIIFKDLGCGIPNSNLKNVFDPFYSFEKPEHAGLGLTFCKKIVSELKGDILVQNRRNAGVKITITFSPVNTLF